MYCIETSLENESFFKQLLEAYPENFAVMKKNNFILNGDNLQVFIALSPAVVTGICQVIAALINSQKEFSFKDAKNGIEYSLKGFSKEEIHKFMKDLSEIEKSE